MSVADQANFSTLLRYAQGWEDPHISSEGCRIGSGSRVLTICGAGDFALWFLALDAAEVIAVDLNPIQIHALELRKAALTCLEDSEILVLFGSRPGRRTPLLLRCLSEMPASARIWWQTQLPSAEAYGAGGIGRFEHYFRKFRTYVLPLCHDRETVKSVLTPGKSEVERAEFFDRIWCNRRWRLLFSVFFSRRLMALLGRSPAQFAHAPKEGLAAVLQTRVRHALVTLDPSENPYLHWILTGTHGEVLPPWMTRIQAIRERLDRLQVYCAPLDTVIDALPVFDAAHLSDIFEYMDQGQSDVMLGKLAAKLSPGGRLAYWNMAVPRQAPPGCGLTLLESEADRLHRLDRAFFYRSFILEERDP